MEYYDWRQALCDRLDERRCAELMLRNKRTTKIQQRVIISAIIAIDLRLQTTLQALGGLAAEW